MTVDLHSAVRTAVDEARRLATEATPGEWSAGNANEGTEYFPLWVVTNEAFHNPPADDDEPWLAIELHTGVKADVDFIAAWSPRRTLAMCDWADDVLARHTSGRWQNGVHTLICTWCANPVDTEWPCAEVKILAAAFGVETGETP